jgi:hypothetical protein
MSLYKLNISLQPGRFRGELSLRVWKRKPVLQSPELDQIRHHVIDIKAGTNQVDASPFSKKAILPAKHSVTGLQLP